MGLPTISTSDDALVLAFHDRAIGIIQDETRAAVEAFNKIDRDLKSDIRMGRLAGIARMSVLAIQTRLANAAVPLVKVINDARAIVDAAMNRQPADGNGAVLWFLKVSDTRRQLERMDKGQVMQAALTLAERGDEVFPVVFLDTLNPLLPPDVAVQFTGIYQKAAAGAAVDTLELAEDALAEIKCIIGCAEVAINASFIGLGIPQEWKDISVADIVKAWPKAARASFVAAKGEEAYTDLLQGRLGLQTALGLFRPGLGEGN
jgi:hypothetical protein